MVVHTAYTLTDFFSENSFNYPKFFDSNYPTTVLTGVLGVHMIYFGCCEAVKRPCKSNYLKVQYNLCSSIALSQGLKLSLKGLSFLKTTVCNLVLKKT